jgi:hypothetical protein
LVIFFAVATSRLAPSSSSVGSSVIWMLEAGGLGCL